MIHRNLPEVMLGGFTNSIRRSIWPQQTEQCRAGSDWVGQDEPNVQVADLLASYLNKVRVIIIISMTLKIFEGKKAFIDYSWSIT